MCSAFTESGETDRQVVLIHVDNTLLAMRTSGRLSRRKTGSYDEEMEGSEYAAVQSLLELQRRLFAGAVPVPGPTSSSSPIRQHGSTHSSTAAVSSARPFAAGEMPEGFVARASGSTGSPFSMSQMLPLTDNAAHYEVSEMTILSAFANVCRSPSTSAVVTGVALTALVDMLDLPCGFISSYGIHIAMEAASDTRAEVHDNGSHEVLLSRIFNVYVAALNHPSAVMAEGEMHVHAIGRMMVLATLPEASQLLKRTVEKSMRSIVVTLFRRLLRLPADPAECEAVVSASTVVLQFISRLISGEVVGFDSDGHEVAASSVAETESHGSASASSGDQRESPTERSVASVQLEGLALAQDCLLLMRSSLNNPVCGPLLDTVQNQLCRSLLIAGLGTSRSIVLAQVLRTVHLVMQGASEHLIPQIYNFIRVLHLNPLETLTNELSDLGAGGPSGSPAASNSPVGRLSPASPVSSAPGNAFARLSRTQLQRKRERRDILLNSLAEFCSDPRFGSFCFIHYDLSWRYSSVLPQLCQVLVNNAYPMGHDDDAPQRFSRGNGAGLRDGRSGGSELQLQSQLQQQQRRSGAGRGSSSSMGGNGSSGSGRLPTGQLLQRTQRTALDAATNMISGIALRAIDAGAPQSFSLEEAKAAPCASSAAAALGELHDLTVQAIKEKEALSEFAALFEDSPVKKGIPYLLEHAVQVPRGTEVQASIEHRTQLILAKPAGGREIGEALYRLSIVLNKRVLGDYIGEQGRDKAERDTAPLNDGSNENSSIPAPAALFSVRFFEEQLRGFIHQFQFHNKPLLIAIREMVYLLCLPGESQKIDRVMETFAKHWYEQNLTRLPSGEVLKDEAINPFHSESGAFVLSFAIIMLNTDQHSGKVAHQMKKEDFVKMNRGIDDGKDVPAEYLGRVYDDVRQHEVVMADMMDRGFGNDTTWRLEMRPCTGFLQIALGDGAAATVQEKADAVESLASMSSHEPAEVHAVDRAAVLRVFDPFLFQSLWKRSLLVFDGMLEFAVSEVTLAAEARGSSLSEAVADAQQRLPVGMSVLQSSLRGVSMLARAAHAFGLPAVADQCLLGLLQHVTMDLSNAEEEVRLLYRSVPKMLCLTEVFALLVDIHSSFNDSWMPLGRLILDMQLMGLFVDYDAMTAAQRRNARVKENGDGKLSANPGSASAKASTHDSSHVAGPQEKQHGRAEGSAGALAVLLQDPGICANVFAPLTTSTTTTQKQSSDRGWFSSLFGGGEAPQISDAELSELQEAQHRIRSCIPDMRRVLSLLRVVAADREHGSRCVMSLCAACSITAEPLASTGGKTDNAGTHEVVRADRISEAGAYAASYELSLICAVVGGVSTPDVLMPEHLAPLTARISRLLGEVGGFLADARASENVRHYWFSVGSRVVAAAVELMAAHWRGPEGAVALEQLWTCWLRAPAAVFTAMVAPHVSAFLYHAVVVEGSRAAAAVAASTTVDEDGAAVLSSKPRLTEQVAPWSSGSEVLVLLAPFATHAAATTDTTVQRHITAVLFYVVQRGSYSVTEDTESVVSLCLSFSVWARDMTDGGGAAAGTAASATRGGRGKEDGAAACVPSGASVAEVLSLCGRNVLIQSGGSGLADTEGKVKAGGEGSKTAVVADGRPGEWYSQWLFVLRSLGALALCSPEARDGSEALLCLQRALLDSEAEDLPVSAVVAVYKDILIPLTERLCVPKAKVQSGLRWSTTGNGGAASTPDDGGSSSASKRGVVGSLFNALLAPSSGNNNTEEGAAATTTTTTASGRHSSMTAAFVSTEVKCRLLSLVPKVLLRYTAALTNEQEAFVLLWRQVLGTLYAVYSAYPFSGSANDGARDEAMLVQEAVEETVKNMVYVMAATWKDPTVPPQLTAQTTTFWLIVARLIQPFPFSSPLMEFMTRESLVPAPPAESGSSSAVV
jgi:hypothetical protein